ncbi:MAG: UDP-glucose 4-epimerase GalE [Bacteroidales bacterium]|nr:UDP-glucose 4-epimerase GalE [Bacteroidales bacterium]
MKKVLLTGGTGFIGSHTAVELINSGYQVVIVDNLSNSTIDSLDGIENITGVRPEFVKADCSVFSEMESLFEKHGGFNSIIHFAALKSVVESVEKPLKYYNNNIISLIYLIQLLQKGGGGNIVFSSSCTVYGQPEKLPVSEESPYQPVASPYGNTKKISEDILRDTVNSNKSIKVVALRYFNPIGAHPSAEIGELIIGKPLYLLPYITQTAIGIRDKLQIFGNDYDSPDGTAIRDYFHVVDLAKAHVLALDRLVEKKNKSGFEVFNLGAGKGSTVLEIVKAFEKVTGVKLNYEIVGRRAGDVEQVWADTSLAQKELGWQTESTLEDALLTAWNWEKRLRGKEGK